MKGENTALVGLTRSHVPERAPHDADEAYHEQPPRRLRDAASRQSTGCGPASWPARPAPPRGWAWGKATAQDAAFVVFREIRQNLIAFKELEASPLWALPLRSPDPVRAPSRSELPNTAFA